VDSLDVQPMDALYKWPIAITKVRPWPILVTVDTIWLDQLSDDVFLMGPGLEICPFVVLIQLNKIFSHFYNSITVISIRFFIWTFFSLVKQWYECIARALTRKIVYAIDICVYELGVKKYKKKRMLQIFELQY
jgi:hypothetical protein